MPTSTINAGGVVVIAATNALNVLRGDPGSSGDLVTHATSGTPASLTNVGGDIYYRASTDSALYRSLRSATSAYTPQAITNSDAEGLYACLGQRIVAVQDAAFFEASPNSANNGECGLWRMRRGESVATQVPIDTGADHFLTAGQQIFEAQGRLYFTATASGAGTADIGTELFRVSATGPVSAITSFDLTSGASGTTFTNFSYSVLPGAEGEQDALFFRATSGANDNLYVIYRDTSASGVTNGGLSPNFYVVNLSGGSANLGRASNQAPGRVVATMESNAWVYYVQTRRNSDGIYDIFRFTSPQGGTAAGAVGCLGFEDFDINPATAMSASAGYSYFIAQRTSGNFYVYSAENGDYDTDDCDDGDHGNRITSGGMTVTNPSASVGINLVFGDDDSVAGGIYVVGSDQHGTQALYLEPGDGSFGSVDDSHASTTQCMPGPNDDTSAANLRIVADHAFFGALQTDTDMNADPNCVDSGANRKLYTHNPQSAGVTRATAHVPTASNPDNPTGFVPFNESPTPPNWAP